MITADINVKKMSENAVLPEYKTSGASGMDVCSINNETLYPGEVKAIDTGLAFNIPEGFEIQVRPRSGLAFKNRITVLNTPGTIDSDYTGNLKIILINHGETFFINKGDRIAQIVVAPVAKATLHLVTELETTVRGSGGFGSTGV
ncbi:MAG: dUTP diphosphatase [Bacteroidia bacterium]